VLDSATAIIGWTAATDDKSTIRLARISIE
jgi:hypothetical protein